MTIPALNPFRNIIGSAMAANAAVPLNQVYVDTDGRSMNPLNQAYSYGQMPFDLDALVEEFRQRRIARVNAENAARMQQIAREAPANVAGRRQSLIELGRMGPQPLANPQAADVAVRTRLNPDQFAQLNSADLSVPVSTQVVPGIGNLTNYEGGKALTGRYGTGVVTYRKDPDPNRKIDGKPAAEWFGEAASRQGKPNLFSSGKDIVNKAMNKKKVA